MGSVGQNGCSLMLTSARVGVGVGVEASVGAGAAASSLMITSWSPM